MLVVDPFTGAMYNLKPEGVSPSLAENEAGVVSDGKGFKVVRSSELTANELSMVVPLNSTARLLTQPRKSTSLQPKAE